MTPEQETAMAIALNILDDAGFNVHIRDYEQEEQRTVLLLKGITGEEYDASAVVYGYRSDDGKWVDRWAVVNHLRGQSL